MPNGKMQCPGIRCVILLQSTLSFSVTLTSALWPGIFVPIKIQKNWRKYRKEELGVLYYYKHFLKILYKLV
jgi:hypothetical protein